MSKPVVKEIQAGDFLDGSIVFENDSQIKGQIEGAIELSDIVENRSTYNIVVGPLYYGPDPKLSGEEYGHDPDDWGTSSVAVLVWKAPRKLSIKRLEAFIPNHLVMDQLAGFGDLGGVFSNSVMLDSFRKINVLVQEKSPFDSDGLLVKLTGAYRNTDPTNWTTAHSLTDVNGPGYWTSDVSVDTEIAAGQYVRILLEPTLSDYLTLQCMVTITLMVTEDHAE